MALPGIMIERGGPAWWWGGTPLIILICLCIGTFFSLEAMPTDEVITWHSTPTRASSIGKLVRIQLWIGVVHWSKTCLIQFLWRFSQTSAHPPPSNTERHWLNPHEHQIFVPEFLRISKSWIWGCFGCSQFIPQVIYNLQPILQILGSWMKLSTTFLVFFFGFCLSCGSGCLQPV